MDPFDGLLTARELRVMERLARPIDIQLFLDELDYSTDEFYRSPLRVLRERKAHCFDGCLFAAAALRRIGYPPLILDMFPSSEDDEHLLAPFREDGLWGAVAKSNFVGLRFREPIHRNLRELMMSYFEQYYNLRRQKTLRSYTRPLNLAAFDRWHWAVSDEAMERIARRTEQVRRYPLLAPQQIARLSPVDERSYRAGLLGAEPRGLFRKNGRRGLIAERATMHEEIDQ
jgi:hypothetical protein